MIEIINADRQHEIVACRRVWPEFHVLLSRIVIVIPNVGDQRTHCRIIRPRSSSQRPSCVPAFRCGCIIRCPDNLRNPSKHWVNANLASRVTYNEIADLCDPNGLSFPCSNSQHAIRSNLIVCPDSRRRIIIRPAQIITSTVSNKPLHPIARILPLKITVARHNIRCKSVGTANVRLDDAVYSAPASGRTRFASLFTPPPRSKSKR